MTMPAGVQAPRGVEELVVWHEPLLAPDPSLTEVLAVMAVPTAVLDAGRRFVAANPALCRMLGYSNGWFLAHGLDDVLDAAGANADRLRCASAAASATSAAGGPMRIRRVDERWMLVEHAVGVLREPDGTVRGYVAQFVDLAEVRAHQLELEADHARLKSTLASLLDPHVLLQAVRDADGRIVDFRYADANDAACAYMRTTAARLIGATVLELLPGHRTSGMLDLYVRTVELGQPLRVDGVHYDNEVVGGERRYDVRGVRVGDGLSFTWRDVTDRHLIVAELAASEARFRLLAQNSSDVVMHVRDEVTVWVSPSVRHATGWDPADWIGQPVAEFVCPDDWEALAAARDVIESGRSSLLRMRVRDVHGVHHWIENHGRPYYDETGCQDGIVASWRIVDAHVAAEEELVRRAHHDGLTGLLNRQRGLELLSAELAARAATGSALAIAFCDVDHFKAVNDRCGHAAGDELLRVTAARIRATVDAGDVVARLGGDELLVVFRAAADGAAAVATAEEIRAAAAAPIHTAACAIEPTLSIGVAVSRPDDTVGELLQRADAAMYAAKRDGRDRVAVRDGADGSLR